MCISNDGPEVFSSYASRKSRSEITVWMPWPLNRDLGGRAKWPSNHFRLYTTRCICTDAQEMRAPCMFDWQGTQTFFSRWNAKSQIRYLVCTLRNKKCAFRIKIQNTHFAVVWKQSKSLSLTMLQSINHSFRQEFEDQGS